MGEGTKSPAYQDVSSFYRDVHNTNNRLVAYNHSSILHAGPVEGLWLDVRDPLGRLVTRTLKKTDLKEYIKV